MRMDPKRLTVIEPAVPVLTAVATEPTNGMGYFNVAENGTLAFLKATDENLAVLPSLDAAGKATSLAISRGRYANLRVSPDGQRVAYVLAGGSQPDLWVMDLER